MTSIQNILISHKISQLTFIDVGAKDSVEFIDELLPFTEMQAFEPNPDEYHNLIKKYRNHYFKTFKLNCSGLGEENGSSTFYITQHSSMSSILKPDFTNYQRHFGTYKEYNQWKNNITINKTIEVKLETLDDYCNDIGYQIDYLKIDTQGSELQILKGAKRLLETGKISVIKIEVSTIQVYENQALFSDVDQFLRMFGYQLVDFITYREDYQPLMKQQKQHAHYAPCGDAVYVLTKGDSGDAGNMIKALVISWLGYKSLAQDFLKQTSLNQAEQKKILSLKSIHKRPFYKVLAKNVTPPFLYRFGKKMLWRIKNG